MVVCYFGFYNKNYSRNKILINGLRYNGVEVIECHSDKTGIIKFFDLIKKHQQLKNKYDVMVVGFPGQLAMILARFLTNKTIIFDAFLSFYDSMIFDRQLYHKYSHQAFYFWFIDWLSCSLADKILLDTDEHIKYFSKTFHIKKVKFHRVFIGADENVFYPSNNSKANDKFTVHFHGTYIPLQGIEYIIEAAKILESENIVFNLVGSGQQFSDMKNSILNKKLDHIINLTKFIPTDEVAKMIAQADICLGIFGNTDKAKRVIPNKLYECLAMKKPVITADTIATNEVFKNQENLLLCDIASGSSLAEAILKLKNDHNLMDKIATNGYDLFLEQFNSKALGQRLITIINN